MTASRCARVPALVYDYFVTARCYEGVEGIFRILESHPIVVSTFGTGRGWTTTNYRKRVSCSWLRKLKTQGVTHVGLGVGSRVADFGINEILHAERLRPRS